LKLTFSAEPVEQLSASALIVFGFEGDTAASGSAGLLPSSTRGVLAELAADGEITGKLYECTLIHHPAGLAARKLLLVGAGKREHFKAPLYRRLAATAVRHLRAKGVKDLAWLAAGDDSDPEALQLVVEGAISADYDADGLRTERNHDRRLEVLTLAGSPPADDVARAAVERGRIIAEAANFTRDLVNEPSNRLTPTRLAERARAMAEEFGLEFEALDGKQIQDLKMGAFWGVARGSREPPRLIVLRYFPADAPAAPVLGLVGKGITFDTGGISIKPAADMHEMKTDMAGGATMLGTLRAIVQLKPRLRVMALIPATENMPGGGAYKPGDVLTSMSGKTIEILNTDAEGRLVLADALTYAQQLGCTHLIDAATLTGAVTIALGNITTGVFGWNQDWVGQVLASGAATGERMWQLPLDEEYRGLYKSSIADLANTGGRYGGAITAAMFVGEFAGETPWVHLDIAGTSWSNEEKPYQGKGPTGHGVPTLVHLVTALAEKQKP
jgi:leucyl aminopeptidase